MGASRQASIYGDECPPVIAPGFDLLNHSNTPNVEVSPDGETIVVRAITSVREGDQLYKSYGPLANASLLIFYGFALPGPNPHDCVELVLHLPTTAPRVE